jgi:hypothetical protein
VRRPNAGAGDASRLLLGELRWRVEDALGAVACAVLVRTLLNMAVYMCVYAQPKTQAIDG